MQPRSVCVVTATRAEYGLLRWVMRELADDPALRLQVVVTGAHLSAQHGETWREIARDGFVIDARVDMLAGGDSPTEIAQAMGRCLMGLAPRLAELAPDLLVVLGDRYELLPICSAAVVLNIPIAHISGGDVTEGAIDNQVRHAITKLAHLHFPGTEASRARIVQMGEDPARVFVVGEPGLENFVRVPRRSRAELATALGLDPRRRWALFTYHPETLLPLAVSLERADAALAALAGLDAVQVVMTAPNADAGGQALAAQLASWQARDPDRFRLFASLGQDHFVSVLREAWCMVGNSSSGIFEAPSIPLPVINIGDRQRGRLLPPNVISSDGSPASLARAFAAVDTPLAPFQNPYGDGQTAARIRDVLKRVRLEDLLKKGFRSPDPDPPR